MWWGAYIGGVINGEMNMSQWQSMETAPKNESVLLNIGGKIVVGHYKLIWQMWQAEYSHDDMGALPKPTHWMPLPDAPKDTE